MQGYSYIYSTGMVLNGTWIIASAHTSSETTHKWNWPIPSEAYTCI